MLHAEKAQYTEEENIWGIFRGLNKRLEANMKFVESYPYKGMVRSYRDQLLQARAKIHHVQNIGPALSQEQMVACHNLHEELTGDWDRLESKLRRLDYFLIYVKGLCAF